MGNMEETSVGLVRRIWSEHGLKPQLVTTFRVSTDKSVAEKLTDVMGPYLRP